jgi:hypothetical protein
MFIGNILAAVGILQVDPNESYMYSLAGFIFCSVATGLADGVLVGYLKNYHPDLAEPWGVGIVISQFFSIIMNLYTTNYSLDENMAYFYFALAFFCSVPAIMSFNTMESIRLASTDAKERALPCRTGWTDILSIIKTIKLDLIGMFVLQFWNDLFMNCVIVIDISKRELNAQKKLSDKEIFSSNETQNMVDILANN